MNSRTFTTLSLFFALVAVIGCAIGPSANELERERIARQQAEQERTAAQQRAEAAATSRRGGGKALLREIKALDVRVWSRGRCRRVAICRSSDWFRRTKGRREGGRK